MRTAGAWRLNEDECTLSQGETTRQLSPLSMRVLVALVEKCGRVVTSKELQERFWPHSYDYGDPGLAQLNVDPFLDPIREDPRFVEMISRLNFEPPGSVKRGTRG